MRAGFVAALVFTLVACADKSTGVVVVVDRAGKPVDGATVTPIAGAISGAPNVTNTEGEALIDTPTNSPPEAISVSKGGFMASHVTISGRWPLRVTLARVADVP